MQRSFLGLLQTRLDAMACHYSADGQSLNAAARELDLLVDDVVRFHDAHRLLASVPDAHSEWRTAIALELAAARLLALAATPLMPRFAAALANSLGLAPPTDWDRSVALVPPGAKIELADAGFFAVPRLPKGSSQVQREEARHADAA
jgi:methionyl-tRNA synthetase